MSTLKCIDYFLLFKEITFKIRRLFPAKCLLRAGTDPGVGAIDPLKPTKSNFIDHDFVQFAKTTYQNQFRVSLSPYWNCLTVRGVRPFYRPLFYHSSVTNYTSSLLQ